MTEAMQVCDNCLKEFPQSKMATHFGYCRRNIKKCPTCGELYDINCQEQHEQEFHRVSKCKYCQIQIPQRELHSHQNKCEHKTQFCQYCQLKVPVKQYPSHLKICEARTKNCDKCNKPVTNKDYLIHLTTCKGPVEDRQQKQRERVDRQERLERLKMMEDLESHMNQYNMNRVRKNEQLPRREIKVPAAYKRQQIRRPEVQQNIRSSSNAPRNATKQQPIVYDNKKIVSTNNSKPSTIAGSIKNNLIPNSVSYTNKQLQIRKGSTVVPSQPKQEQKQEYRGVQPTQQKYGNQKIQIKPTSNKFIYQKVEVKPSSNKYIFENKNEGSKREIQNKKIEQTMKKTKKPTYDPRDYMGPNDYNQYQENYGMDLDQNYQNDFGSYDNHGSSYARHQPAPNSQKDIDDDEQFQKAILMSMQGVPKSKKNIPKELQVQDEMSKSFYSCLDEQKQKAIYEQIQRDTKKNRR